MELCLDDRLECPLSCRVGDSNVERRVGEGPGARGGDCSRRNFLIPILSL